MVPRPSIGRIWRLRKMISSGGMLRRRRALLWSALLGAVALHAIGLHSMGRAAESPCDPSLPQAASNPYGYRLRGDRCEGVYAREVGAASLTLASLTESFQEYDARSGRPLVVEWSTPAGAAEVHLRAVALRRRLYYRMDTVRASGTPSYEWSPGLLAALGITRADLGIVGSARVRMGGIERTVYVPVRIAQGARPARARGYSLVVVPGVELAEVFVSVAAVGADGRPQSFLRDGQPLGHGYYPAERAIEIPIAGLPSPGTYYVEVGAKLRAGETSSLELWLLHAGDG
jgi:hypothetical protein